ncbi:hypothetical protein [Paenibacillus konkukensis]|nr:hypothetical protein [Paenibacillus konkukensis]
MITVVAYSINFILEFLLNMAFVQFQIGRFLVVIKDGSFAVAVLILFIDLLLCYLLSKYRIGFSFIPKHNRGKFVYSGQNKQLMTAFGIALGALLVSSLTIFFIAEYAFYFQVLVVILWGVVLRMAYQKEVSD